MASHLKSSKLLADSMIFFSALVSAYLLRFGHPFSGEYVRQMMRLATFLIPVEVFVFAKFGLYRRVWRYPLVFELSSIAKASLASMILASDYASLFMVGLPRSVVILNGILTFLSASMLRVGVRALYFPRINPEWSEAYVTHDNKITSSKHCAWNLH